MTRDVSMERCKFKAKNELLIIRQAVTIGRICLTWHQELCSCYSYHLLVLHYLCTQLFIRCFPSFQIWHGSGYWLLDHPTQIYSWLSCTQQHQYCCGQQLNFALSSYLKSFRIGTSYYLCFHSLTFHFLLEVSPFQQIVFLQSLSFLISSS